MPSGFAHSSALLAATLLSSASAFSAVWYDAGAPARRPLIAGNWKLNPTSVGEAKTLLRLLAANRRAAEASGATDAIPDVAIFPPACFLSAAVEALSGTSIQVGAQNIGSRAGPGAFTGEIAPSMVASLGCSMVLLGHSERRSLFDEDDELIASKVRLALDAGLAVVLCVGETKEEYEAELLGSVVHRPRTWCTATPCPFHQVHC